MKTCTCGHVDDEHEGGYEFCLVELDDGTHCPCIHFEADPEAEAL